MVGPSCRLPVGDQSTLGVNGRPEVAESGLLVGGGDYRSVATRPEHGTDRHRTQQNAQRQPTKHGEILPAGIMSNVRNLNPFHSHS